MKYAEIAQEKRREELKEGVEEVQRIVGKIYTIIVLGSVSPIKKIGEWQDTNFAVIVIKLEDSSP